MSWWTSIRGTLTVDPYGSTIAEQEYVLNSVLNHQPMIWQDGGLMETAVHQSAFPNHWSTHDEFGEYSNLVYDRDDFDQEGMHKLGTLFFITLHGDVRHDTFDDVFPVFMRWLCRLAKRVSMKEVFVTVFDYNKKAVINYSNRVMLSMNNPLYRMYDYGKWALDNLLCREEEAECLSQLWNTQRN